MIIKKKIWLKKKKREVYTAAANECQTHELLLYQLYLSKIIIIFKYTITLKSYKLFLITSRYQRRQYYFLIPKL